VWIAVALIVIGIAASIVFAVFDVERFVSS
jgi:hypothetical protein